MKRVLCIVIVLILFRMIQIEKSNRVIIKDYDTTQFSIKESDLLDMDLDMYSLIMALDFYKIEHKEIVLAQAILETGWFKSYNCKERNNLFGLFNSKKMEMHKFSHWSLSVKGYKTMVQYRYKETDDTYFHFLKRIKYAEDPDYIPKLYNLIEKHELAKLVNN